MHVAADAFALHAARVIECFGTADQYLLRVASAQCAGSTEGAVVDDRNAPTAARTRIAAVIAAVPVPITIRS